MRNKIGKIVSTIYRVCYLFKKKIFWQEVSLLPLEIDDRLITDTIKKKVHLHVKMRVNEMESATAHPGLNSS